jgi:hypothetical protein
MANNEEAKATTSLFSCNFSHNYYCIASFLQLFRDFAISKSQASGIRLYQIFEITYLTAVLRHSDDNTKLQDDQIFFEGGCPSIFTVLTILCPTYSQ